MTGSDPPFSWWQVRAPLLAATIAGLVLYFKALFLADQLADERYYLRAIEATADGVGSGTVAGWYYTETAARIGALIVQVSGEAAFLRGLRVLGLIGAALTAAVAGRWMGGARWGTWIAALLMLVPPIQEGVTHGNVSGLLTGMLVAAVLSRSPAGRIGWLVPGFLLKPYALGFATTRPLLELAAVLAVALLALLDTPGRVAMGNLDSVRNAAPIRALHELGLHLPWQAWTGIVLSTGLLWRGNHARGFCMAWLALPLSWTHSATLLIYPLAVAVRQQLDSTVCQPQKRAASLLVLTFAALVVFRASQFGLLDGARWLSGLFGLLPCATAVLLLAWCRDPAELRAEKAANWPPGAGLQRLACWLRGNRTHPPSSDS